MKIDTSKLSQKQLEDALIENFGYYPITYLSKEDLEDEDFDVSDVDDTKMREISIKMADIYLDNGFWEDMRMSAEKFGVNIKK